MRTSMPQFAGTIRYESRHISAKPGLATRDQAREVRTNVGYFNTGEPNGQMGELIVDSPVSFAEETIEKDPHRVSCVVDYGPHGFFGDWLETYLKSNGIKYTRTE